MPLYANLRRAYRNPRDARRLFLEMSRLAINTVPESLDRIRALSEPVLREYYRALPASLQQPLRPLRRMVRARGPGALLRPGLSRTEFFAELNRRNVRYVLLRWWEDFPDTPAGDMDILVEDRDIGKMADLLVDRPSLREHEKETRDCDIYTVAGSGRWTDRGLPCFPPPLARQLLDDRRLHREVVYVPAARPYFAALAYHAVYHKPERSGIEGFSSSGPPPTHHYPTELLRTARAAGVEVEPNATALVDWLRREGLAPGRDTLAKLVERNRELEIFLDPLSSDIRGGELCVFVVRERAEQEGLTPEFLKIVRDRFRMDVIRSIRLEGSAQRRCTLAVRGGKWDKGPFPESGGEPARLIVAFDPYPQPPTHRANGQMLVTNSRMFEVKLACRRLLARKHLFNRNYNAVHSADNEHEAIDYLRAVVAEEEVDAVLEDVERRRERYFTRFPVRKILSKGRRAKVELIEFRGGLAVKKTFKIGAERFLDRELMAARDLAPELDFIPPLLDQGDGYLIVPYYENVLQDATVRQARSILAAHRKAVFTVIQEMYERNLAVIDFKPKNTIVTPEGRFVAFDYEFLQPYAIRPASIDEAYDVVGLPQTFDGDIPFGFDSRERAFSRLWRPYVGDWQSLKREFASRQVPAAHTGQENR